MNAASIGYKTDPDLRTGRLRQLGPYHSLKEGDAMPMKPDEVTEIRFNLYATSVLIKKGHQIRVAIAGHDVSMFSRYPEEDTPVFTILHYSYIELTILQR